CARDGAIAAGPGRFDVW
nr:immunoglobulin heavy chain junction region [Macaca mulatta]MPO14399.1 immunoglobulin heavy chain junction region [Macaca mulatta]MPO14408.1 immunoglobulin heavy chain junction region [Macaca mulatta]MPO14440.1 immunoglobulin heavy chain junction region [Macaca mulatta]MPO14452.1 immunoglobulin heavy chain junction region [Macaca mulatta]